MISIGLLTLNTIPRSHLGGSLRWGTECVALEFEAKWAVPRRVTSWHLVLLYLKWGRVSEIVSEVEEWQDRGKKQAEEWWWSEEKETKRKFEVDGWNLRWQDANELGCFWNIPFDYPETRLTISKHHSTRKTHASQHVLYMCWPRIDKQYKYIFEQIK